MKYLQRLGAPLLLVGALVILFWMLADKCQHTPAVIRKPDTSKADSAIKAMVQLREASEKKVRAIERQRDSALVLARAYGSKLTQQQRQIAQLGAAVKLAKDNKDTTGYIVSCDSLQEIAQGKADYAELVQANYEAATARDSAIIATQEAELIAQRQLFNDLKNSNTFFVEQTTLLGKQVNKLQRQAGRTYAISPYIGYGIGPSLKPTVSVGIAITKRIKFLTFKL